MKKKMLHKLTSLMLAGTMVFSTTAAGTQNLTTYAEEAWEDELLDEEEVLPEEEDISAAEDTLAFVLSGETAQNAASENEPAESGWDDGADLIEEELSVDEISASAEGFTLQDALSFGAGEEETEAELTETELQEAESVSQQEETEFVTESRTEVEPETASEVETAVTAEEETAAEIYETAEEAFAAGLLEETTGDEEEGSTSEEEEAGEEIEVETISVEDTSGLTTDELFEAYVNSKLYAGKRSSVRRVSPANYGSRVLSGASLTIYNELKKQIVEVAASGGSTEFKITGDLSFTFSEESRAKLASGNLTDAEKSALYQTEVSENVDSTMIIKCLLIDCPYDLYWYDKTEGASISYGYYTNSYNSTANTFTLSSYTVRMTVINDYRDTSAKNSTYTVTSDVSKVKKAVENAESIALAAASKSTYEKLAYFKDQICDLTAYNYTAAGKSWTSGYSDPWQLIYVFDGDSDTKVVCEGYAKAFKYLCDLSVFSEDKVACYIMTGTLKPGGGHMWNVVTINDSSYLCDITNVDSSGNNETASNRYYMNTNIGDASGYSVSDSVSYTYDDGTTALYTEDIRRLHSGYAIKWIVDNTSTTSYTLEGEKPAYPSGTPVKVSDHLNTYTFTRWDPEITKATAAATYTAQFSAKPKTYTISLDANGGSASWTTKNYTYQSSAITLPTPTRTGYTFAGWTGTGLSSVTKSVTITPGTTVYGNRTYTANWTPVSYRITWKNNGSVLRTDSVPYNQVPSYSGSTPKKVGNNIEEYVFTGWSPTVAAVTGDAEYTAQFRLQPKTYTISVDTTGDSTSSTTQTYDYQSASITLPTPARAGYIFTGWTGTDITAATMSVTITPSASVYGDRSYTANWQASTNTAYTVRHYQMNTDGKTYTLKETEKLTGTTDTTVTPAVKTYTGFTAPSVKSAVISGDGTTVVDYYYSRKAYRVRWKNDSTVLSTSSVLHGVTPSYSGSTPTKAADSLNTYKFTCWSPAVSAAAKAVDYTAQFSAAPISYTIRLNVNGGSASWTTKTYTYQSSAITLPTPARTGYTFTGWTGTGLSAATNTVTITPGTSVYGNRSYTANWTPVSAEINKTEETEEQIETEKTESTVKAETLPTQITGTITPENPVASSAVETQILTAANDNDQKGSSFGLLQAKGTAKSKTSIKLSWNRISGATGYRIYGNRCGKKYKYAFIAEVTGTSYTLKKLTKGTSYKYVVVAVSGDKALTTSTTVHVSTKGGKLTNPKSVTVKKSKVTLKAGKTATIKAAVKAQSSRLTLKKHRKLTYESSNTKVATVSAKGKIKAVGKGTCYIYVYSQSGVSRKVKVTVK